MALPCRVCIPLFQSRRLRKHLRVGLRTSITRRAIARAWSGQSSLGLQAPPFRAGRIDVFPFLQHRSRERKVFAAPARERLPKTHRALLDIAARNMIFAYRNAAIRATVAFPHVGFVPEPDAFRLGNTVCRSSFSAFRHNHLLLCPHQLPVALQRRLADFRFHVLEHGLLRSTYFPTDSGFCPASDDAFPCSVGR